jgi:hypothetical protein
LRQEGSVWYTPLSRLSSTVTATDELMHVPRAAWRWSQNICWACGWAHHSPNFYHAQYYSIYITVRKVLLIWNDMFGRSRSSVCKNGRSCSGKKLAEYGLYYGETTNVPWAWYYRPRPKSRRQRFRREWFSAKPSRQTVPCREPLTISLQPPPSLAWAFFTTTPHTRMHPYLVFILLVLYHPECKLVFEVLNVFKLKSCQLQSFITFWDL